MRTVFLLVIASAALAIAAPGALAAPPANDTFAAATALAPPPTSVTGTLDEATRETGEPSQTPSVWYTLTVPATTAVRAQVCDVSFDSVLSVYTGAAVNGLTLVAANDDACERGSIVTWTAVAGVTYHIAVTSFDALMGTGNDFTLRLDPLVAPPNDAFADARVVRNPGRLHGSNVLATRELGEPAHAGFAPSHSVWFRYRARATQTLSFDTAGSNFDTVLGIYRGDIGSLRRIASNDDARGLGDASLVRVRVRRGLTYFIALDGVEGVSGDWELGLSNGGAAGVGLSLAIDPDQSLDRVRTSGLRTSVRCVLRCRLTLEARIGASTARRLGLGRRATTIARTQGRVGGADPELPAVLRLSRRARSALAGERRLTLTVVARLRGTAVRDRSIAERVTLTG